MPTERSEGEAFIAETTVSQNNTTSLPKGFRNDADISEGDTIQWYVKDGVWIVRKESDGSEKEA